LYMTISSSTSKTSIIHGLKTSNIIQK